MNWWRVVVCVGKQVPKVSEGGYLFRRQVTPGEGGFKGFLCYCRVVTETLYARPLLIELVSAMKVIHRPPQNVNQAVYAAEEGFRAFLRNTEGVLGCLKKKCPLIP